MECYKLQNVLIFLSIIRSNLSVQNIRYTTYLYDPKKLPKFLTVISLDIHFLLQKSSKSQSHKVFTLVQRSDKKDQKKFQEKNQCCRTKFKNKL